MYDVNAVKRMIGKNGIDYTISVLISGNLSEDAKTQLSEAGLLVNGHPNLSLIYSLA